MNRIFTWLRSLRKSEQPSSKVDLDKWLVDNKAYIESVLSRKFGSKDLNVSYGFFDRGHGSPPFEVPPVYCPDTVPGWGYINGRKEAKRILPQNGNGDFLTEADDDMEFTEYAVFLNSTLVATLAAAGGGLWMSVLGKSSEINLLDFERLAGEPQTGMRHLGISLLYTFMQEYEYRLERRKATTEITSYLIKNFA